MAISGIPWRGPGDARPDLPLPPAPMPLRRDGGLRKRWRYIGFFNEGGGLWGGSPIESIGPSGSGWGWTRKRAGVPMSGHLEVPGRRLELRGFGVDDESA